VAAVAATVLNVDLDTDRDLGHSVRAERGSHAVALLVPMGGARKTRCPRVFVAMERAADGGVGVGINGRCRSRGDAGHLHRVNWGFQVTLLAAAFTTPGAAALGAAAKPS
jgi:hypothetical protein